MDLRTAALRTGLGSGSSVLTQTSVHSFSRLDFLTASITAITYCPSSNVAADATASLIHPLLFSTLEKASLRADTFIRNGTRLCTKNTVLFSWKIEKLKNIVDLKYLFLKLTYWYHKLLPSGKAHLYRVSDEVELVHYWQLMRGGMTVHLYLCGIFRNQDYTSFYQSLVHLSYRIIFTIRNVTQKIRGSQYYLMVCLDMSCIPVNQRYWSWCQNAAVPLDCWVLLPQGHLHSSPYENYKIYRW